MREEDEQGNPRVYWLTHGTSRLRCSVEQVRPAVENIGKNLTQNLERAREVLEGLRRRGVTQFIDQMRGGVPEGEDDDDMSTDPFP